MTYEAESYYLDVATDAGFNNFVSGYENKIVTGTAHEVTGLDPNTTYYYRIRAKLPYNTTANSNVIDVLTESNETYQERILFSKKIGAGLWQAYSMLPDGSDVTLIDDSTNTLSTLNVRNPFYDPNSDKYFFSVQIGSYYEICSMNWDGSGLTQLTSDGVDKFYVSISGDGSKLAYRKGSLYYTSDSDGTNELSSGIANPQFHPFLNADASKMLFSTLSGSNYQISIANLDGSGLTVLDSGSGASQPRFTNDYQYIIYRKSNGGFNQTYKMTIAGTDKTRLTTASFNREFNTPSPDDSKIAFQIAGTNGNICVFDNAVTNTYTQLTNTVDLYLLSDWKSVRII